MTTHDQRVMLVDTLCRGPFPYTFEQAARLTDSELHEQWLFECEYDGGIDHIHTHEKIN